MVQNKSRVEHHDDEQKGRKKSNYVQKYNLYEVVDILKPPNPRVEKVAYNWQNDKFEDSPDD